MISTVLLLTCAATLAARTTAAPTVAAPKVAAPTLAAHAVAAPTTVAARAPGLLGAAAPTASASATVGAAQAPVPQFEETAELESYLEGSVRISARRLPQSGPAGRARVALTRGARTFEAEVDDHAVVQALEGLPQLPDVEVVRALLPQAGLALVRSTRGEDGLALAARLAPLVQAGALQLAAPDLWLPHVTQAIAVPPNDPRYSGQWYLKKLNAESAWRLGTGSAGTVVTVVDDGCDLQHPELVDKLLPGRDVVSQDDDPSWVPGKRGNEHGTACAGLVAASTDNGVGIAGMCPECKLRCVRLIPSSGELVPVSSDVDAFAFALRVDSAVVSNSWGYGPGFPVPLATAQAIRAMEGGRGGKGAVVVFAAGNASTQINPDELQAVENVFTVGATNTFDEAAPFSNKGACVAAVAPTGTLTLDITGSEGNNATDYTQNFGGTSSACPLAAGLAGLVVSANPALTAAQVRALLIRTVRPAPFALPDDAGHDLLYGYGVLDARAALEDALGLPRDGGALPADAGARDGGPAVADAGAADAGADPMSAPRGCGCGAAQGALLPLLATALARRRRLWVRAR